MAIKGKIAAFCGVEPRDMGPTITFALHIFTAIALLTIVRSLINALALDAYPRSFLPYLFAGQSAFYLLFSALYSWSVNRFGPTRIEMVFPIGLCLFVAASRIAMIFTPTWLPFFLYVTLETFASLMIIQSWTSVSNCLDSREAKRILPIAGAAGTIGAMSGGGISSLVAAISGAENLLVPCLVLIIISLANSRRIAGISKHLSSSETEFNSSSPGKAIWRDPLLIRFVLAIILTATAFTVIDYQFKSVVQANFDKDKIAGFLGVFFAVSSIFTFIVQTQIEGRLLRRFGMVFGLASLPLAILAGSTVFFFLPGLWAAAGTIFFANTASYSLNRSARELTLMPYIPRLKQQLKILCEGIIRPAAVMLSSGAIALAAEISDLRQLSAAAALVGTLAIFAIMAMKKPFTRRLEQALSSRRLELINIPALANMTDPATAAILNRGLLSDKTEECLFSLELIRKSGIQYQGPALFKLFSHPDPKVRTAAVQATTGAALEQNRAKIVDLLARDKAPIVQATCLKELRAGGASPGFDTLSGLLVKGNPEVRAEAAISLFSSGGLEGIITAAETTKKLLNSNEPEELIAAAKILGALKNEFFARDLMPLLFHEKSRVRQAAMAAAGNLGGAELAKALIEKLRVPEDAFFAIEALGRAKEPPIDLLGAALSETDNPAQAKAIISTLSRINCGASAAILLAAVKNGKRDKRFAAIKGLGRLRRAGIKPDIPACLDLIKSEISRAAPLLSLAASQIPATPSGLLLKDETAHRLAWSQEAVFRLLGLIYNPATVHKAYINFASGTKTLRANALELLEHLLPRNTARDVLTFLEAHNTEERPFLPLAAATGDFLITAIAAWGWPDEFRNLYPEQYARSEKMIPVIEKIFFLKSVPFLTDLASEQLQRVAEIFSERNVSAGTVIFREGDPGNCMYIIAGGRVKVKKSEQTIATLGKSDFFGEMALLEYARRAATVTAETDTDLLVLDTDNFSDLVMEYPEIALGIMRTLSRRLRRVMAGEDFKEEER